MGALVSSRGSGLGRQEILEGLRRIGVAPGMRLMVHSSLSSFGRVEGGAASVAGALMEAVGPEGTLMMPTFNHGAPFRPGGPGYYDPRETPTSNGAIPEVFWRMPGVARSLNPTHPFAAWGRDAERFTAHHHETLTMGGESPLGLLAREDGYQLNLGTSHETTTAKHVAEMMREVPCLGRETEWHEVRLPGGTTARHHTWGWRGGECPLTESGKLIEEEMERRGAQKKGSIGPCPTTIFRIWDCLEAIWHLLDNGHGAHPPCSRCPIRPGQARP